MKSRDELVETPWFDRLLDGDSRRVVGFDDGARSATASVANNLRWILNSHVKIDPLPNVLSDLDRSSIRFGVPDLLDSEVPAVSLDELPSLLRSIIATFEPRLNHIRVQILAVRKTDIQVRVAAMLLVPLAPSEVSFLVDVRLSNGEVVVKVD